MREANTVTGMCIPPTSQKQTFAKRKNSSEHLNITQNKITNLNSVTNSASLPENWQKRCSTASTPIYAILFVTQVGASNMAAARLLPASRLAPVALSSLI